MYYFRAKINRKVEWFPIYSCLYRCITSSLSTVQCYIFNLHWHIIITQSPQFILVFTLGFVHFAGLDKCIVTYTHQYNIMQNFFTFLKILCVLSVHLYPLYYPPLPLATIDLFIIAIVLSFPEYHIIEIIQSVAFSDWFIWLSNMPLRFLIVFSWLDTFKILVRLVKQHIPSSIYKLQLNHGEIWVPNYKLLKSEHVLI